MNFEMNELYEILMIIRIFLFQMEITLFKSINVHCELRELRCWTTTYESEVMVDAIFHFEPKGLVNFANL